MQAAGERALSLSIITGHGVSRRFGQPGYFKTRRQFAGRHRKVGAVDALGN